MNVVRTLLDAGLTLRADGERLLVSPREDITPALRSLIQENKPSLLAYARQVERTAKELVCAINRCCDLRGDDPASRVGLIRECLALPPASQAEMEAHFRQQAAVWSTATGKAPI